MSSDPVASNYDFFHFSVRRDDSSPATRDDATLTASHSDAFGRVVLEIQTQVGTCKCYPIQLNFGVREFYDQMYRLGPEKLKSQKISAALPPVKPHLVKTEVSGHGLKLSPYY